MKKETTAIPITSRNSGEPYKAVVAEENVYLDIRENGIEKSVGYAVNSFYANQKNFVSKK